MKKILFVAFAFAGFSNIASAQAKERQATMTAVSQEESARDTKIKEASLKSVKSEKQNTSSYKSLGLSSSQVELMKQFDKKRAESENNNQLTTEQKSKEVMAVETERQIALKKALGEEKYKKYLIQKPTSPAVKQKAAKAN